jgi:hypothetical protein
MATYQDRDAVTLDTLNKKNRGLAARSVNITPAGEIFGVATTVDADKVFMKGLPLAPPPASDADVVKHFPASEGGDGVIYLTCDRDVPQNLAWVGFPVHLANHQSGAASAEQNATAYKNICTAAKGPAWSVQYFMANGTPIPEGSIYAPTMDPDTLVVRFAATLPAGNEGASPATSPYLKCYRRIGQTLAEATLGGGIGTIASGSLCARLELAFLGAQGL